MLLANLEEATSSCSRVDGSISVWTPVKFGVPQGTLLGPAGPLMFLIYMNNYEDKVSSSVWPFADDCVLTELSHPWKTPTTTVHVTLIAF